MENQLPDHIEEYLDKEARENVFIQLFEADDKDIDLKTDLNIIEVQVLTKLKINDKIINNCLGFDLYREFIDFYERHMVSFERKSRGEFVDINKKDRFENNLNKFNSFKNLTEVKQ